MVGRLTAGGRINHYSTVREFVGGALAFVVAYLVIYVKLSGTIRYYLGNVVEFGQVGVAPPDAWQVVGWVFFAAHHVTSGMDIAGGSSPLTIQGGDLWVGWFVAVPILVLVIAGFLVARASAVTDVTNGATYGGAIVVGYLPLVAVATFLTAYQVSVGAFTASAGPNTITALLLAGVLYPVVFGAIGGAIAGILGGPR